MYKLIASGGLINSPIKEFGVNSDRFQLVLQDMRDYRKILDLTQAEEDIAEHFAGKIGFSLADKPLIINAMNTLFKHGYIAEQAIKKFQEYAGLDLVTKTLIQKK